MNKLVYFIVCLIVSSYCDNETWLEATVVHDPEIVIRIVEEKCTNTTGDPQYFLKLGEYFENSHMCVTNISNQLIFNQTSSNVWSEMFNAACAKRDNYFSCLSIGLNAYSECLTTDENVELSIVRSVFRRVFGQICLADLEKILEFLRDEQLLMCYLQNIHDIIANISSLFYVKENPHLPSSYINNETCGNLINLQKQLQPVLDVCANEKPGIFLNNLINAIEDELACEQYEMHLTKDNEWISKIIDLYKI